LDDDDLRIHCIKERFPHYRKLRSPSPLSGAFPCQHAPNREANGARDGRLPEEGLKCITVHKVHNLHAQNIIVIPGLGRPSEIIGAQNKLNLSVKCALIRLLMIVNDIL